MNATGQLMGAINYELSDDSTHEKGLACHIVNDDKCIAQSFLTMFSSMASFFWTSIIAIHLYFRTRSEQQINGSRNEVQDNCTDDCVYLLYHIISWGIPLTIVVYATVDKILGSDLSVGSGAWCWISACLSPTKRTVWMTISGKGWEVLMYFVCLAFYILIKCQKWKRSRREQSFPGLSVSESSVQAHFIQNENERPDDIRFLYLWLVEVCLRFAGTIRYIVAAVRRHSGSVSDTYNGIDKILLSIQSLGDSGQGFCSFLIFCVFDKEMRNILKSLIFCRCCNVDSESTHLLSTANTDYQESRI